MPTLNTAPPGKFWGTQGPGPNTDLGEPDAKNGGWHVGAQVAGWAMPSINAVPSAAERIEAALASFAAAPRPELRHRAGLVVEAVAMAVLEGAWHEGRGEPTQKGVAVQSIVLMVERAEAEAVGLLRRILDRTRDTASLRRLAGLITNPDGSQPVLAQHGTDRHADATRLAWDMANTTRCPITLRIAPLLPNNMTAARAILTAYLAKADRLDAHRAEARAHLIEKFPTVLKAAGGAPGLGNSIRISRKLSGAEKADPRTAEADALAVQLQRVRDDLKAIEGFDVPAAALADLKAQESDLDGRMKALRGAVQSDVDGTIDSLIRSCGAGELTALTTLLGDVAAIPGAFPPAVRDAIAAADPLAAVAWKILADGVEAEQLDHLIRE